MTKKKKEKKTHRANEHALTEVHVRNPRVNEKKGKDK